MIGNSNNNNKFVDWTTKTLAVVGAVAVLSVGGFFTVTVLRNLPEMFGNLTAAVVNVTSRFIPAERIEVTLDNETPKSGDTVNLSFEHLSKSADGSYLFFYECREDVYFERVDADGDVVFCNTPYNFVNTDNTFSFKVFSSVGRAVEVPLSINFVRNNTERVSERGEAKLIVGSGSASSGGTILITDNRPSTTTTTRVERQPGDKVEETFLFDETSGTTAGVSNPNGKPDLKATVLNVGKIDRVTNVFTATSSIPTGDRGAIRFEIENVGTKSTGSWVFNVVVPTFPAFIYHSKGQPSLLPGDKIEYTIGFDSIRNDGAPNTITVNADPISSISELDETNNIAKSELPAYSL